MNRLFVLLALLLPLLAGCASREPKPVAPAMDPGRAFIIENHAAAQLLAAEALGRLEAGSRVLVATFVDLDDLESASPLGRVLSEQVATVLSRAGYEVVEVRLRRDLGLRPEGEFALSRRAELLAAQNAMAEAVLVGAYAADSEAVLVSARVVRTGDNVLAAAHDWSLPNRGLAARLLLAGRSGREFEHFLKPVRAQGPVVEDLPGQTMGQGSPFRLHQ